MVLRFVLSAVLALWSVAALAQPVQLQIAGEIVPRLDSIDRAALRGFDQDRITHITFHHEGFAGDDADLFRRAAAARERQSIVQRVQNINHYHATQAGLGIFAYHYAVDKAGNIARGRPVSLKPGTLSTEIGSSRRADFAGHFAVVALGDFNHESLTPAARLAYVRVMSEAQRAYRVPSAHIQPHKHHASTSCPGKHILDEEEGLRQMVLVYSMQAELAARGCLAGAPDGRWGAKSKAALRAWQRLASVPAGSQTPSDTALLALLDAPAITCN